MGKAADRRYGKKETITPPSDKTEADASKQLRAGHSSGARAMADRSVAKKQGAARPAPRKRR